MLSGSLHLFISYIELKIQKYLLIWLIHILVYELKLDVLMLFLYAEFLLKYVTWVLNQDKKL